MSAKKSQTKPAQKKAATTTQKRAESASEVNELPEKVQKPKAVTQRELLDAPAPTTCPQGGEHEWTDDECSKCHEPKLRIDVPAAPETADGAVENVAVDRKGSKKPATTPKAAGESKSKNLSALDAAAQVLGEAAEPMTTGQMIEAMAAKGYWSSPNGQTPAATLYSAILRQINTKGTDASFKRPTAAALLSIARNERRVVAHEALRRGLVSRLVVGSAAEVFAHEPHVAYQRDDGIKLLPARRTEDQ